MLIVMIVRNEIHVCKRTVNHAMPLAMMLQMVPPSHTRVLYVAFKYLSRMN